MNVLPEKQKIQSQSKEIVENKPKFGQGRTGIRCKNLQPVGDIYASASKSGEIPKVPTVQNVTRHSTDFPVQEQLITKKTEAITRGMIQDKNRELPFYPDPIYRHPPRPPGNL